MHGRSIVRLGGEGRFVTGDAGSTGLPSIEGHAFPVHFIYHLPKCAGMWAITAYDYSLCNELLALLGAELGVPGQAAPMNTRVEWECRVGWKALRIDDLTPDAIAQIRQENLLDQRLWETWHEARQSTVSVKPRALGARSSSGLITANAKRLVCQLGRRIQRRWAPLEWLANSASEYQPKCVQQVASPITPPYKLGSSAGAWR